MSETKASGRGRGKSKGGKGSKKTPREEPASVIYLIDAEGREHPHEILEVLDVGDFAYAALLTLKVGDDGRAELDDDHTELTFLRIERGDDGEDLLVDLDDPAEIDAVFDAWTAFLDGL